MVDVVKITKRGKTHTEKKGGRLDEHACHCKLYLISKGRRDVIDIVLEKNW